MSVDTLIARMRSKERRSWRSEGTVTRASGNSTFNEVTGEETADDPATIYEGICQVRTSRGRRRDAQVGEQEVRIAALEVKFPANAEVLIDDVLELTRSTYDAGLVGRSFRITDVEWDDWQITRVAQIEEVTPDVLGSQ